MQDGLYVISGETFDGDEVIAGFRLFKKLKKKLKKLKNVAQKGLKLATPALTMASFAMPALAPAAAATAIASRLTSSAKRGNRPARAAMRMFASSADRGDSDSARFLSILQRVSQAAPPTLMNSSLVRELAKRARQGNPKARSVLRRIAGLADQGDPKAQALLEQAAGSTRWDLTAGHSANKDLEVMGGCVPPLGPLPMPLAENASGSAADIVSGGPVWDYFKPRRSVRTEPQPWGPRDAYRLGIEAVPLR